MNLLCSLGDRRSGSSYLVGKMHVAAQSIPQDAFEGTDNVVDGLELEETPWTLNIGKPNEQIFQSHEDPEEEKPDEADVKEP